MRAGLHAGWVMVLLLGGCVDLALPPELAKHDGAAAFTEDADEPPAVDASLDRSSAIVDGPSVDKPQSEGASGDGPTADAPSDRSATADAPADRSPDTSLPEVAPLDATGLA